MFSLFVDSSNSVDLYAEWDIEESAKKIEDTHRSRNGKLYRYTFGSYEMWKFSTEFVSSETAAIVNSWWITNTELKFMEVTSSGAGTVYDVVLTNRDRPFSERIKPYQDQFTGVIELEEF